MQNRATVITDASYCGDTQAGGWACWIVLDNSPARIRKAGAFNNCPMHATQAELWAALNGVHLAVRAGATHVLLQTDCLNVVDMVTRKGTFVDELNKIGIDVPIDARHVRGHTRVQDARSHCNRWCDREARKHMKLMRKVIRCKVENL